MLRKLVGYAAYMFGANTFTALLNFAVSALGMVTRPLEAFGDYAIYMLVYEIGTSAFINGANQAIQKFGAGDRTNRLRFAKMILIGFMLMMLVFGAAAVLVGYVFGHTFALALIGLPWVVTYWYGRYIVRSSLDARGEATLMVVASLANTIFQFLFLTLTDLRDALIYGDFLALVVSGGLALILLPRGAQASLSEIWRTPVPRAFQVEVFRFIVPLWLAGQVFTIKHKLQGIWTGSRIGSAAMGTLQAAVTFWQFASKPMEYLGQASLPGLVAAREDRDVLYREVLRFSLITLSIVGIGVAGGIPLVFQIIDFASEAFGRSGPPMIEKFADVPAFMMLFALVLPFTAVEMVTNQYSVAVGRQKIVLYAQIANVIVIAITMIPLAEAYGLWGVMISGTVGEIANAGTFVVMLRKQHRDCMRSALLWSTYTLVGLTAALAPLFVYREATWGWLLTLPALLVFVIIMFAARLIQVEDLRRVWRAYKARGGESS